MRERASTRHIPAVAHDDEANDCALSLRDLAQVSPSCGVVHVHPRKRGCGALKPVPCRPSRVLGHAKHQRIDEQVNHPAAHPFNIVLIYCED